MVTKQKLTAEAFLSAPQRSPIVPNHNGKLGLYTVSTHTFGSGKTKEVRLMQLDSAQSVLVTDDDKVQDAQWIPGTNDVLLLKSGEKGKTQVLVVSGEDQYEAVEYDGPVSGLKLTELNDGGIIFSVVARVNSDGLLYNGELEEKKTSARVFDTYDCRALNQWLHTERYSIWYTILHREPGAKWQLSKALSNAINNKTLDTSIGVYEDGDAANSYDICHRGIAFLAKELNYRAPQRSNHASAFFVAVDSYTLPPSQKPKAVILPEGVKGGTAENMRFAPDGSNLAFLYGETDHTYTNRLYMASTSSLEAFDVNKLVTRIPEGPDFNPPEAFEFTSGSDQLLIRSSKCGRSLLASLTLQDGQEQRTILHEGSVAAFYPLTKGNWEKLLVSSSSFIDSSLYRIVSVPDAAVERVISSATKDGSKFGISADMVSEFWFEGADELCIQAFMVRPSDFDENKQYPWVLLPHGGPLHHWSDSWSPRWNMAAWAEQGYIMILPNITGSMGFGVDFARRIENGWGDKPFKDLLNLITYLQNLPYLDQNKAVLAGASYGGYMLSWIFGHEIIKKFACAIWHAGVYNIPSFILQTDQLVEDGHFGHASFPWIDPDNLERWNPATPDRLAKWCNAPPTLLSHGEKDYRVPITEGLAAFRTLQGHRVPSRFLVFDDESHGLKKEDNLLYWHTMVWDWVKKCVDGEIKRDSDTW